MTTLTADDWIMAAAVRLGDSGVDAVKVEPLAAELGVSKGSFYWHFSNREGLLTGVLAKWEALGTEAIINAVERDAVGPQRLHRLLAQVFGNPQHDGIELGIRAWARRDPAVRLVVSRVDARRVDYVAALLVECDVPHREARTRAEFMYRTLIGEFVLRSHGAKPLPSKTLKILGASLLRPTEDKAD